MAMNPTHVEKYDFQILYTHAVKSIHTIPLWIRLFDCL